MLEPVKKHAVGAGTILAIVIVLTVAAGAEDFWRKKPTAQWTAEEALQVVQDSPWAHEEVVLSRPWTVRGERERARSTRRPNPNLPPPLLDPPGIPLPTDSFTEAYLVRWESAQPVTAAFARLEQLGQQASAHFQAPPPRVPPDRYVVSVKTTRPSPTGTDVFGGMKEDQLRERARLKTRLGLVAPLEVERRGVGASAAVHFFFPRLHQGQPLVRAPRDVVEFQFDGRRTDLHSKFTLETTLLE